MRAIDPVARRTRVTLPKAAAALFGTVLYGLSAGVSAAHYEFGSAPERTATLSASVVPIDVDGKTTALDVTVGDRQWTVDLVPSPVLPASSRETRVAGGRVRRGVPAVALYQGRVRGAPQSRAAVAVDADGTPSATLLVDESIYEIRETRRGARDATPSGFVADRYRVQRPAGARVAGSLFVVELGVVADFEFFQTYGSGSAARMQTIVNEIDALFRDDVGATFRVTESVVFETVDDPFGEFTTGDTFADYEAATEEFGDYRAGVGGPLAATDLAHLFSQRRLSGSFINAGFGFFGTLCNTSRGISLTTVPSGSTVIATVLLAHELGHNLDARHDGEADSPCEQVTGEFIMRPNTFATEFSQCSVDTMTVALDAAPCVAVEAVAVCGDLTGDGEVLASDALAILKNAVGPRDCEPCACDAIGGDGVTASDALAVLKKAVGAEVELDCPACV